MLTEKEIRKIEKKASDVRKANDLGPDRPIGSHIFDLIEEAGDASLLLFPSKSKNVCGFTRKKEDNIQVYINSSQPRALQYFIAAHEWFHMIRFIEKETNEFVLCKFLDVSEDLTNEGNNLEELKANYFAAAILLPTSAIEKKFEGVNVQEISLSDMIIEIIKIKFQYEVPYKTILKRLLELEVISDEYYEMLKEYESKLLDFCKMLDKEFYDTIDNLKKPSNRKYHSLDLPKTAADVYKSNAISFSKLKNILDTFDKGVGTFDIEEEEISPFGIDFSIIEDDDEVDDD
jgi:Zn-dependent peptidase ImmA (M78 family)